MTTEIAIMNRQGIALAADSAVTIGRQRVWKTANKLFSLGPHNDIAIMTYNLGDFLSYPWETIIKCFRAKVGSKKFETVNTCAEEFVEFLKSDQFKNSDSEKVSVLFLFGTYLDRLKKDIDRQEPKTKKEFKKQFSDRIAIVRKRIDGRPIFLTTIALADFIATFKELIASTAKEAFKVHLTQAMLMEIYEFCFEIYRRKIDSEYDTGVVFAGFGTKEHFPCVVTYIVDGKFNDTLRAWRADDHSHNLNDERSSESIIIPFGQDDVAVLFLEGMATVHLRWIRRSLGQILGDKSKKIVDAYVADTAAKAQESEKQVQDNSLILTQFFKEFEEYRNKSLIQKIMGVVATLPKEEMAAMAGALVELTSLRRKVDSPLESVGGPTDIALISKGDGLIWIKRKHYFDMSLNGDFKLRKDIQLAGSAA